MLDKEYKHYTVNHDLHFVVPITKVHTNSVESIWNSAKMHFKRMRGCKREYIQSYLDEFMFRRIFTDQRTEAIDAILNAIAKQYVPGKIDDSLSLDFENLFLCENEENEGDIEFETEENDDIEIELELGDIEDLQIRKS